MQNFLSSTLKALTSSCPKFILACGISLGPSAFFVPLGLVLPALLLGWLLASTAGTVLGSALPLGGESTACTKLDMLGIVCAACGVDVLMGCTTGAAEVGDSIGAVGAFVDVGVICPFDGVRL